LSRTRTVHVQDGSILTLNIEDEIGLVRMESVRGFIVKINVNSTKDKKGGN
jgi:hypothetical protein